MPAFTGGCAITALKPPWRLRNIDQVISLPPYLALALAALLAYLIGGLPFGYWFVRGTLRQDIRKIGSGNIGATNVHRAAGKKAGFIVLFLDIFKGFVALWVAALITGNSNAGLALATVAVMLGHCYPAFLGFKGGKAVACFVGATLYLAPLAVLATALIFVAVVVLSKYISLA
jgi:glycerol-3-phosphate acyltransferase PlsY